MRALALIMLVKGIGSRRMKVGTGSPFSQTKLRIIPILSVIKAYMNIERCNVSDKGRVIKTLF
jgi:hypothetical protein